jgi:hypothetical protein
MKPVWYGCIILSIWYFRREFRILVKSFASQLIREIGLQFFKDVRSPFFGKSRIRTSFHDWRKICLVSASLNIWSTSFPMSGIWKRTFKNWYPRPSSPGLLILAWQCRSWYKISSLETSLSSLEFTYGANIKKNCIWSSGRSISSSLKNSHLGLIILVGCSKILVNEWDLVSRFYCISVRLVVFGEGRRCLKLRHRKVLGVGKSHVEWHYPMQKESWMYLLNTPIGIAKSANWAIKKRNLVWSKAQIGSVKCANLILRKAPIGMFKSAS